MLTRDPSARATATEVLNHAWVKEDGVAGDVEIEPEVCGIAAHACCGCASPLSMMGCAAACRGSVMSPPWQHMAHAPSACSSLVHHSTALRFLSYGPGQLVKRPSRRSTVMM